MEFDIVALIQNVGFPIALVIYLMVRFEKKIEKLDDSINNLASVISNGTGIVREREEAPQNVPYKLVKNNTEMR